MPPASKIGYYPSRKGYYTCFRKEQILLAKGPDDQTTGPTYLAALAKFQEIMQLANADTIDQGNTVRLIVDLYGQHLERNGQARSLTILLDTCTSAIEQFGDLPIGDLKPKHVSDWLDLKAKPRIDSKKRTVKWGPTYRGIALRTLVTALNWAKGQGLISKHCLEKSKAVVIRGKKRSRGKEAYIPPQTFKTLIDGVGATNLGFADLLRFLYGTGCRPSEAYHVEARYYHRADKCIVYPGEPGPTDFVWKNARRTGKDRVIMLSDELAAMVEARIDRYPEGRIFRTKRDTKWVTEAMSVNLRWYAKRLKISPAPTAYGFRHTYATNWLLNAGSIKILADLIGTSVAMIERHYGHLMVDKDRVRAIMTEVMKNPGSLPEKLEA